MKLVDLERLSLFSILSNKIIENSSISICSKILTIGRFAAVLMDDVKNTGSIEGRSENINLRNSNFSFGTSYGES